MRSRENAVGGGSRRSSQTPSLPPAGACSYEQGRRGLCALGPELPTDSLRSFCPNAQRGKCRRWEQLAFQPSPILSASRRLFLRAGARSALRIGTEALIMP